ncbi:hypothetical protein CBOM_04618 [Ceraceosorus bombacis]|uniref:Uncharacterized protein n=1 Tax=Ceraceosorus bombacis TaxID=401625 RepID=A0A0P1BQQ9_9BASI|nr:hypothetical protein CBOM_04618 [Ceraceosorus bombacis]
MAPANASHRPLSIALLVLSVLHTIIIVAAGALAISVLVSAPFGSSPAISAAIGLIWPTWISLAFTIPLIAIAALLVMRSGRLAKWPMAAVLVCTICVTILCILGAALYTARDPTEFSGFADDGDCYTYPFTFGFGGSGCYRGSSSSSSSNSSSVNAAEVGDVKSRAVATLALAWLSAGLAIITTINSIFLVLRAKRDRAAQLAANNASYNQYYASPPAAAPAQSAYETAAQLAANNASYNQYYAPSPPAAPAQSAYETYGQPPMAQTGAPPYSGGNQYAAPPTTAVI